MDSYPKVIASGPDHKMSKFRKHSIALGNAKKIKNEETKKKFARKRVEGVAHSSINEK